MAKIGLAVFASGKGSNFVNLLNHTKTGKLQDCEIRLFVTDKPQCQALRTAMNQGINVFVLNRLELKNKDTTEAKLDTIFRNCNIHFVLLAGYMRLLGQKIVNLRMNKILNIHPSLLPAFPGKNAVERAYNEGESLFGATVHYVDEGMDTGEIILQQSFEKTENQTLDELTEKIQKIEHEIYPAALRKVIADQIQAAK